MKIKGLKHLNSNFYDFIMIRNKKDELTVEVKNTINIPTIKTNESFFNSIKHMNEKERTTEIIRYYLRNNFINKIYKGELSHYDGKFMIIEGSRNLYLQITKEQVDENILNEILEKYKLDRIKYLTEKRIQNIAITSNSYSGFEYGYFKNEDNFDEYTFVNLNMINNELMEFEKDFLIDFIEYMLSSTNEIIKNYNISYNYRYFNYYKRRFEDQGGHYFICDDKFKLRVDKNLYLIVYDIVLKHNRKIENDRKLQLKLF